RYGRTHSCNSSVCVRKQHAAAGYLQVNFLRSKIRSTKFEIRNKLKNQKFKCRKPRPLGEFRDLNLGFGSCGALPRSVDVITPRRSQLRSSDFRRRRGSAPGESILSRRPPCDL